MINRMRVSPIDIGWMTFDAEAPRAALLLGTPLETE